MSMHAPSAMGKGIIVPLLVLAWGLPTAAASDTGRSVSGTSDIWSRSVRQIETGGFEDALSNLVELRQVGPHGQKVAEWLRTYQELAETRERMTREDRARYIRWSQEQHAKALQLAAELTELGPPPPKADDASPGDEKEEKSEAEKLAERVSRAYQRALDYAVMAYDNSADRDAFQTEPWLRELYQDAVAYAAGLRADKKWLEAHGLYYQLGSIFERDKELKRLRRECLTHARLEVFYTPDSKWEEHLAGIEWRMVEDALWKVDKYYVSDVDFRELTVAGLEQLALLASSPTLAKVFPTLGNEYDRTDFINRINQRIVQAQAADRFSRRTADELFRRALEINTQTVQLPAPVVISEFMSGAMETLDEFSSVIWPVEYREFAKRTEGEFIGVGISISKMPNGNIMVVTPLEDSPAYYAGVKADDVILKVDGQSTEGMSLTKAVETITGPIDTTVTLTIRRKVDGQDQEIDFPLKRKRVTIQSIKGAEHDPTDPQQWEYMLDPDQGIGYIRLVNFQQNTVEHLRKVIEDLRQNQGLKGLILDLRFNPGGLLRSAVETAELFLSKDDKIVSTKGERTREYPIPSRMTGPFVDLPLVVLINGQSASASEIVSGALKDHNRATIVGERTFGKFSVQNLMQLSGTEAHLKLTTAAYYLPSGKSLHRTDDATEWGVDPNIAVTLVPKELEQVWLMRRDSDVIRPPGWQEPQENDTGDAKPPADQPSPEQAEAGAEGDAPAEGGTEKKEEEPDPDPLPEDPNLRPKIDPQLETALLVLRVQLTDASLPQMALHDSR